MYPPLTLSITIKIEQRGPRGGQGNWITLSEATDIGPVQFGQIAAMVEDFEGVIRKIREKGRPQILPAP